ncbi:NAD(P)/FAD-dependent oxidoreductase [Aliifodinibius sp. S!AR15-10]|uniref:dihydrolipoyl dehydrogenase family protein n=1 Tax=Aliifodinibius sp. S!AR15-10 TaxID=2950437 RepID=UPI002862F8FE|nr:NAD(P)/FAD-dependent oxidoreductase [Aliifodinibius sp. S!AR15-10]MDR8389714.1 NAD(P)/FAD-dependent oxidoreductase [Aliifodinibius sp. S!AR15-10]
MRYDYDLVVIGGGAAGLTASGIGANFGAKTMMIEAEKLGGDCTWYGCIPSKTLLHASKMAHTISEAEKFGHETGKHMNFSSVMENLREKRQEVYEEADDPDIYREMGIDIEFGKACFLDDHTISIEGGNGVKKVSSRYFIIATGSKAVVPPIPGLKDTSYYTNETLFEISEQPQSLAIIGAGPIGIEMAQAFQRLGTQVTVFDQLPRLLSNDDEELADMLQKRLQDEGVTFKLSSSIEQVSENEEGEIMISGKREGAKLTWKSDALLVATGRAANHNALNLDTAGVNYTKKGITVSDRCRTNVKHIYAAGDVTGRYQFTHMSEHMAKVAATNALLKVPIKIDKKHVPWSTYTDPELAHVGATKKQLKEEGTSYEVYRFPYEKVDRALTDDATDGLIKIFAKKWNGKILGATIYGHQAGDLISEYALAMRHGVTLRNIADTIHPYPSYGLGVRRAADQWYVKNQSEWLTKLIKWVFRYRGEIPDLSDKDRIV